MPCTSTGDMCHLDSVTLSRMLSLSCAILLFSGQEILQDMPFITEFGERWPALFSESEVNAEFSHITTVPLLPPFMSQLDRHSSQLMKVFKKKVRTAGRNLGLIMAPMDKDPTGLCP